MQPCAVHAHTELKSLLLTLWLLQSLLMSPAILQIGIEIGQGQIFCRLKSGFHSQVVRSKGSRTN